eukprot:3300400-Pleurochrysis_carterae.AAC.1
MRPMTRQRHIRGRGCHRTPHHKGGNGVSQGRQMVAKSVGSRPPVPAGRVCRAAQTRLRRSRQRARHCPPWTTGACGDRARRGGWARADWRRRRAAPRQERRHGWHLVGRLVKLSWLVEREGIQTRGA